MLKSLDREGAKLFAMPFNILPDRPTDTNTHIGLCIFCGTDIHPRLLEMSFELAVIGEEGQRIAVCSGT